MLLKSAAAWNTLGEPVTSSFFGALTRWKPTMLPADAVDLGPDADREHRDIDLVELLEGGALLPELVVGRMRLTSSARIPRQHLGGPVDRILVNRPQLPLYQILSELAGDAAAE